MNNDIQYLKKYVKQRPDNQMGWYLLGKQYEQQNKHAKAAYCFLQAGEVYTAFEKKPLPDEWRSEHKALLANGSDLITGGKQERRIPTAISRWSRRVLLPIALLFLLLYIPTQPEGHVLDQAPKRVANEEPHFAIDSPEQQKDDTAVHEGEPLDYALAIRLIEDEEHMQKAASDFVLKGIPKQQEVHLVRASKLADGRWIDWLAAPQFVLSAQGNAAAQMQVRYYDAESCSCEPSDVTEAQRSYYKEWQQEQEERLVLYSALYHYEHQHGKAPQELSELTQAYPRNILSGTTQQMKEMYDAALFREHQEMSGSGDNGSEQGENERNLAQINVRLKAELDPLFSGPLEIMIDKGEHRLAIVSGKIIIRSYPVGLGAERTPEGVFLISEKVHSPNGRTDGDYGSRGMTLSDTAYAIHGTLDLGSIEQDESLGCIRLTNEDVEELFAFVPLGTKVTIGQQLLPKAQSNDNQRFELPFEADEKNANQVYRWLN